jgi:hypothetical protein
MLIFPQGIRLAGSEDLLNFPNALDILNEVNAARIEAGYTLFYADEQIAYNYAEINIDSQHAWALFCSLCEKLLPTEVQLIIGGIDDEEELFIGRYSTTLNLLELLEQYKFYLVNDCHIQFGFVNLLSGDVFEVFIATTKHFKVWTDKVNILKDIMKDYNLPQVNDLQFIDEFPRITIDLEYSGDFYEYQDLIDHLIKLTS